MQTFYRYLANVRVERTGIVSRMRLYDLIAATTCLKELDPIHAMFVPAALNRKTTIYQSDEIIGGTLLFDANEF